MRAEKLRKQKQGRDTRKDANYVPGEWQVATKVNGFKVFIT